ATRERDHSASAGASVHARYFVSHGTYHGSLPGVAKFARRSGWRSKRERTLCYRKSRPTSISSRTCLGSSCVVDDLARGGGDARLEFHSIEQSSNGFPIGPRLGGRDWIACSPVSRQLGARQFRAAPA